PATILVRPFKVDISGPLVAMKNGQVRRARVEPYVENVVFLAPLGLAARAFRSGGQQFFRRVFVPGVCAFFFEPLDHVSQQPKILEALAATFAIKNDNRRAPEPLT